MGQASPSDLRPWQVERRRLQNTAAQRRRRQKQKDGHTSQGRLPRQQINRDASDLSKDIIPAIYDCFATDTERSTTSYVMAAENFSLHDVVKYGLISLGYAAGPEHLSSTEGLPFRSWAPLVLSSIATSIDVESVIRAGVKALIRLKGPLTWSGHISPMALAKENEYLTVNYLQSIGSPTFTIKTGFFTASLANCRLLGIDPSELMNHDAESPFMRTRHNHLSKKCGSYVPCLDEVMEMQRHASEGLKGDMCPTLEQLTIPHHPYLDIIPWPSFRSRAIIASSMDPPLINKNDLCLDLLSDGMYCRSIVGISLYGRGEGMPWDSRSWEAKPWFLKKWSFLVTGADVQQTSLWWRSRS